MRVRVAAIVVHEGRILLVSTRRGKPGYLVPPGGGVEEGEGLAEAVEREVREEAGLAVRAGKLLAYRELQMSRGPALELYLSACLDPGETPPDDPAEDRDVLWVALDELPGRPHFPGQLIELARLSASGASGALFLGTADLRAVVEASSMTQREANGE